MTQEEKELLLRDLSARLPYGVKYQDRIEGGIHILSLGVINHYERFIPYLRPMSSMTDEEIKYKLSNFFKVINTNIEGVGYKPTLNSFSAIKYIDWLNKNHFDYHGLIEKGLAIKAPD